MTVRLLKTGDEKQLESFLSNFIETSMFMLGNLRRVGASYKNKFYHGEYLGSFSKSGEMNGVFVHYWNGNVMMQTDDENILNQLIDAFKNRETRPIAGVLGERRQAQTAIVRLGLSNAAFATNTDDKLYVLDLNKLVMPLTLDTQSYRVIEVSKVEKDVLTKWYKAFKIEALRVNDDDDLNTHVENDVNRMLNGETDRWVLEIDGKLVSLSGFNARLPHAVQIGPVWTSTEYRRNGYARTLLALTLQKAKSEGVNKAILFTNVLAAEKAYKAIGFKQAGFYRLAILKKPTLK